MIKLSLNTQILLGSSIGILLGFWFSLLGQESGIVHSGLYAAKLMSTLFIDLLRMVLIPLVFTSIIVGVANLRSHGKINRVWQVTLIFFIATMALAILLGLAAANLLQPGKELQITLFQNAMQDFKAAQVSLPDFFAHFLHSLFQNPIAALSQGNVLAVVVFALLFGIALVLGGERYRNILILMQEFLELFLMLVGWIMRLAPLGIMALLLELIATQDTHLLGILIKFVAIVLGTTFLHGVIVLPLILYLLTGVSSIKFWRGAREALITAFATSSSSATLPVTLRCAEQYLHVKRDVAGFVIPLGATMNMDGTALYEAIAALFIANLVGIELSLLQQTIVFLTAMVASIGAPGIPSAGMVTMAMVLQSVGLPVEAIAILIPVDRILDGVRTMVNVEGDLVGSLIVQKWVNKVEQAI